VCGSEAMLAGKGWKTLALCVGNQSFFERWQKQKSPQFITIVSALTALCLTACGIKRCAFRSSNLSNRYTVY